MTFVCGAPDCGREYDTRAELGAHFSLSGHGEAHRVAAAAATFGSELRPYACTFPGCRASYRSSIGRKIHQTLAGHQPIRDTAVRGDGVRPGPRHPAYRNHDPV